MRRKSKYTLNENAFEKLDDTDSTLVEILKGTPCLSRKWEGI